MSVSKGVGIPVKLLHEAEGHVVTIELKTGETFRGELKDMEDNWNSQLENVTATARDGRVTHLGKAFIRGSKIRYVVAPDMLKNAPMFKRLDPKMKVSRHSLFPLPLFCRWTGREQGTSENEYNKGFC